MLFALYRSGSALAQLYGTEATLEHHHFNHAVMILNSEVFTLPDLIECMGALSVDGRRLSVCLSLPCLTLGRERKGLGS